MRLIQAAIVREAHVLPTTAVAVYVRHLVEGRDRMAIVRVILPQPNHLVRLK